MAGFAEALRALPLAGAAIGGVGALALALSRALGLSPLLAAALGVAALVLVTGGLHEDGLADVADGFGGGATRERKLEIMRDSRIGSYGGLALGLSLLLRVFALAALAERSSAPRRRGDDRDGRRVADGGPRAPAHARAGPPGGPGRRHAAPLFPRARPSRGACGAPVVAPALFGAAPGQIVVADLAAGLAAMLVARLAERQIGGYTGDVLGAAQQVAEIAALLALSAG